MSAQMHDRDDQYFVRSVFIQNSIGKAMDHAPSNVSSDLGPSGRMLHDFVDGALDLPEEILPQPLGLLFIVECRCEHFLFGRQEQARRLHLILS